MALDGPYTLDQFLALTRQKRRKKADRSLTVAALIPSRARKQAVNRSLTVAARKHSALPFIPPPHPLGSE